MAFKHYLEEEDDKPYFTTNSLGYYYDKMEGFAEKVEQAAKTLNLTKEEVEKNISAYIEQNKNELDQRLAQWDGKLETFDSSVETLLTEWVDDGTLTPLIDSTLIDQKIAPVTAKLAEKPSKEEVRESTDVKPINVNEMDTETKQLFTGGAVAVVGENAVGSENIKPKAVVPWKTAMFTATKNLLDVHQVVTGYADFDTGVFTQHSTLRVTHFIPIGSNLDYVMNNAARGYVFYDGNKSFISSKQYPVPREVVRSPENAKFMRVTLNADTILNDTQLEQNTLPTPFIKPHILDPLYVRGLNGEDSISNNTIGMNKLNFTVESTKNLFNYLTDIDKGVTYADPTNGTLSTSGYSFKVTKPYPVTPESYYVSNSVIRSIAFYDNAHVFVSGISTSTAEGEAFATPANATYMRINFSGTTILEKVQIEKGAESTSFEPYHYVEAIIPAKSIAVDKLGEDVLSLIGNPTGGSWEGKTFVSLGTSIPWYDGKKFPDGTTAKGYQSHLKEKLGFATYVNAAMSGKPMSNGTRAGEGTNTTGKAQDYSMRDLVLIDAASNDFKTDAPLGTKGISSDTVFDNTTFYGAYRELIQYILAQNPTIQIVIFTPPRRKQSGYTDQSINAVGNVMYDYIEAVYEIGELYGLPVVDFWRESGFNWYTANTYTIDGVHPNNLGFERLGDIAVGRIKNI